MNISRTLFRDNDGERRIFYHHDGLKRHWLHFGSSGFVLSFEVGRVPGMAFMDFAYGEMYCEGIKLGIGAHFGAWLRLTLPFRWRRNLFFWPKDEGEREWGLHYFSGELEARYGFNTWASSSDPTWRRRLKLFDWRWIVGKDRHAYRVLMPAQRHTIAIDWWDGDRYEVDITLEERTWKNRVRTLRQTTWNMSVPQGMPAPPFPGKGENSWDCGDDGLHGAGVNIDTVPCLEAALAHFGGIVEKSRLRYGSRSYRPAELKP